MTDKFLTLHPDPAKTGVNIDKSKYEYVKKAVLVLLKEHQPLTPKRLFELIQKDYGDDFDGSITWYTEGVKLDIEAREVVAHDRKVEKSYFYRCRKFK